MNWIKAEGELPKTKVLAKCGNHEESMTLGKLHRVSTPDGVTIACIDNDLETSLANITHYIILNSLIKNKSCENCVHLSVTTESNSFEEEPEELYKCTLNLWVGDKSAKNWATNCQSYQNTEEK